MRGVHLSFDSEVSRWRYAEFSFIRLKSVYKSKVDEDFAGLDLLSFDLVNGDRLTNAGALFVDVCPVRGSRLFCTRWNGLDKASGVINALDDKEDGDSLISNKKVAHGDGKVALEECMMVHGYSVRERDRVFQILETYGFEADFRRKDFVGQFELAPPLAGKFLRKLKQTGLIVSGNRHGLYRMNGNCAVKGEGK